MDNSETSARAFQYDFDRAISARFAPRDKRQLLLLLVVFDHELSKIRYQTSEPLLRRIRTQFWRDTLEDKTGGGTTLVKQLIDCFAHQQPLRALLEDLIDTHEKYIEEPNSTRLLWDEYNDRQAVLFRLAVEILVPDGVEVNDGFYDHCGVACGGISQLCKNLTIRQLSAEEVEQHAEQVRRAHHAMAGGLEKIPRSARPGILPLALVLPYLHLFQRARSTPIEAVDLHPAKKTWLLWRAMRKGF